MLSDYCARIVDDFYLYIASLNSKHSPKFFSEKFPGDIRSTLLEVYPNYREILIWRDPLDVCNSMIDFNKRRSRLDFGQAEYGDDVQAFCRSICETQKKLFENVDLVNNPGKFLTVKYVELVDNPLNVCRDISNWLNLDWNSEIENYTQQAIDENDLFINPIHRR